MDTKRNMRSKSTKQTTSQESDGVFILKLVLYVILGSLWLKITPGGGGLHVPVPIGLLAGILFTTHEIFQMDRKIEYAVLVCAAVFGYVAPYGLFVNF